MAGSDAAGEVGEVGAVTGKSKADRPSLAGTVNVAVTLTGAGNVTGVNITNHTWSGAGSQETEACIKQKILGWHFPSSDQGGGTYSFSFVFSK